MVYPYNGHNDIELQILDDSTYMKYLEYANSDTDSVTDYQGWREGRFGALLLNGYSVSVWGYDKFWI